MVRRVGWRYDSVRHALAARGVPTGRKMYLSRRYDAIGYTDMVTPFSTRLADVIGKTKVAQRSNWFGKLLVGNQSGYYGPNPDAFRYPMFSVAGQVERVGRIPEIGLYGITNAPISLGQIDPYTGKGGWIGQDIGKGIGQIPTLVGKKPWWTAEGTWMERTEPLVKPLYLPPKWWETMNKWEQGQEALQKTIQADVTQRLGGGGFAKGVGYVAGAGTEVALPITPLRAAAGVTESLASDPLGTAAIVPAFYATGGKQLAAGVVKSGKNWFMKSGNKLVPVDASVAKGALREAGVGWSWPKSNVLAVTRTGPYVSTSQKTYEVLSNTPSYVKWQGLGRGADVAIEKLPGILRKPTQFGLGAVTVPFRAGMVVDPAYITIRGLEWVRPTTEIPVSAMNVALPKAPQVMGEEVSRYSGMMNRARVVQ